MSRQWILTRRGHNNRWHWSVYKAEKGMCEGCKLRTQCTISKAGHSIIRYDRQEALDFALAHLKNGKS